MQLRTVKVENPDGLNIIMGQSRVIRTVNEIHEVLVGNIPGIRFGVALNENDEPEVAKFSGTDESLVELARRNAANIGADHLFVLLTQNAFPVRVMKSLKEISDISKIYCATDNPVEVIVADSDRGCGVMGLLDDHPVSAAPDENGVVACESIFHKIGLRLFKSHLRSFIKTA